MQEVRREIQEESKRQEQDRRMRQEAKERSRENTRQEESCHARAGLWTGSKTWNNKTSCKSRKLEEASGKSKKKQQEARERSRQNPKTWNKKACRNSKKLYPWLRRRFKGLGMQVGSQKATLGTRNSRPEAVSALQWDGVWAWRRWRFEGSGMQLGYSFLSAQKATIGAMSAMFATWTQTRNFGHPDPLPPTTPLQLAPGSAAGGSSPLICQNHGFMWMGSI